MTQKKQLKYSFIPISGLILGTVAILSSPNSALAQEMTETSSASVLSETTVASVETPVVNPTPAPSQIEPSVPVQASNYTINSGDTLWRIASKHGVTVAQLKAWNGLTSDAIQVNQVLRLSPSASAPVANTSTPATSTNSTVANSTPAVPATLSAPTATAMQSTTNVASTTAAQTYTIQAGDTLSKIARTNNVTVADLRKWNNLTSSLIYPNQKLVVKATIGQITTKDTATSTPAPVEKVTTPIQPAANNKPLVQEQANAVAATYVIKRGDSLNKIAAAHGVTVDQLRRWNNISGSLIHPNQVLKIGETTIANPTLPTNPASSSKLTNLVSPTTSVPSTPATSAPATTASSTYAVKSGDTLFRIARANGVSVDQLIKWNNISNNMIRVNQQLIVSAPGQASNTSPSTSNDGQTGLRSAAGNTSTSASGTIMNVPLLSQKDPRWANETYGNDVSRTIWENGCAIVSLAMVDSYYKGQLTNPAEIAKWAGLRHYVANVGTAWTIFEDFGKSYGYDVTNHKTAIDHGLESVKNGNLGIVSVKAGHFINAGHLMVVRGVDANGDVYVSDPYDTPARNNSGKGHAVSLLKRDALNLWTFSPTK